MIWSTAHQFGPIDPEDIRLREVMVDCWGGFVFVNLDPDAEPLRVFLEPAASKLDPYQFDRMRFRWRKWLVMPCNWKVALEAFNESYHVQATHRQLLEQTDDATLSAAHGKHGQFSHAPIPRAS